jgi:hypothetical protein
MPVKKYKILSSNRGEINYCFAIEGLETGDELPKIPKKCNHILFENCFIDKGIVLDDKIKSISIYESYVKFKRFPKNLNELAYRRCDDIHFPRNFKKLTKFYAITTFRCYEKLFSLKSLPETTQSIVSSGVAYEKNLKKLPRDIQKIYLMFYQDGDIPTIEKYHKAYSTRTFS